MALEKSTPRTTPSERQIVVYSNITNEHMYTVPAGKTFVGTVLSNNPSSMIYVNGVVFPVTASAQSTNQWQPVTFLGGTVITKNGTVPVTLMGVES